MILFDFNSSERRGLLFLAVIILLSIAFKIFSPYLLKKSHTDFSKFKKQISEFEIAQQALLKKENEEKAKKSNKYKNTYYHKYKTKKRKQIKYFRLNPNTASISDWEKFGFSKKQSKIIYNYIKKSGGIKTKTQLKNIFVISNSKYNEIKKFIIIDKNNINTQNIEKNNNTANIIEINSASKENLMLIKGIGDKLSDRIIKYRNLLGGFYKKDQLKEVYGITPENFEKIKDFISIDAKNLKQININFSNEKDLSSHPYISYKEAKAIVKYRTKNGFIKNVNLLITNNLLNNNKALPYLISQD